MRNINCALSLLALTLSLITSAQADDLQPPSWRGGPLSTVAEWDFLTPNLGPPDGTSVAPVVGNGGGTPLAAAGQGLNWNAFGGSGAWVGLGPNGGIMSFEIPNWIDKEPIKYLQIQMTYLPDPADLFPSVVLINPQDPLPITLVAHTGTTDFPLLNGTALRQRIEQWQIMPNPDFELIQINIPANVFLSQVVIDTISVPEPSSLVLGGAALGALAMTSWIRKRRPRTR